MRELSAGQCVLAHMGNSLQSKPTDATQGCATSLAKPLAPEDIRVGDYVSLLHVYYDVPSFFWCCDAVTMPVEELVRLRCLPENGGLPLKVKAVCLPFLVVKHPAGGKRFLDVRKVRLARLDDEYAAAAWKVSAKSFAERDCR